jgi:hypothetical protein
MRRRLLLSALACWPGARLLAQDEEPRPRQKISAAQLHKALSARFPLRLGLPGLLDLQVSAPRLLLLPTRNQPGASLLAQASGQALHRTRTGEVDVAFALRYEASDRTVRAHKLELLDLRIPGLTAEAVQALRSVLPEVAREALGEVVLHQFTARDLALPDTMGFEPDRLTVVDDGLVVEFREKQRR